jgi:hypothetical protein
MGGTEFMPDRSDEDSQPVNQLVGVVLYTEDDSVENNEQTAIDRQAEMRIDPHRPFLGRLGQNLPLS